MDPAAESQKIRKMPARYKKWGKVRQTELEWATAGRQDTI